MRILVTGGAGYIGSHTVSVLVDHGHDVTVVDNLTTGHRESLAPFAGVRLVTADIRDSERMTAVLRQQDIDAVIHFAALSLVGHSMTDPLAYYHNNVGGTERLLSAMKDAGVSRLVFSSTAAVYGEPMSVPIAEDAPTRPTNPYGETKRVIENMLAWAYQAHRLTSVSLRYFNAAGAHPNLPLGEDHHPETHLIPRVLQAALRNEPVPVYGTDYPTPDGTAVRDYIHVLDLAEAHRLALEWLEHHPGAHAFNLGNGQGFSVRQVIDAARLVTQQDIPVTYGPRRAGDPAQLVASVERAQQWLGWTPRLSDLTTIVQTAWDWHRRHPWGY
ncbi:UDP-galactose 4-epimerase [Sulfobacillus acidophilus DSM 10332]|uniref:UDP-glucose 4-epimerase n=1 Tax=Sulfobacillus acidophilus (strain ATCC 700253 / DSM 10332 / NAL) TaxID=679936 RepID=G8TSZ0_SULAD|nr:UDP-galactose 4-epimerase [Sulfobacillus acidophilus DSM 10332]